MPFTCRTDLPPTGKGKMEPKIGNLNWKTILSKERLKGGKLSPFLGSRWFDVAHHRFGILD